MSEGTTRIQMEAGRPRLFRQKFSIQVVSGPDRGKSVVTAAESTTVGTAHWNDLVLQDPTVSRHHLRIKISPEGFLLTDLDSTNGTIVGSLQLRQAVINGPANLKVGDNMLRFTPLAEEEEVTLLDADRFGLLAGRSAVMRELFRKLERISRQDTTVLIEGETGTGKELVAREIHEHSARVQEAFVVVDCGAIPPTLLESELFGHVEGAFTGANTSKRGPFESAERGTVFLDEIGELEPEMQPKLLRVLERKEIKRVGENHYIPVDVRIIAATSRDLSRAVNQATFRADLYYRLAVAYVTVPPLRHRLDDVQLLIETLWPQVSDGAQAPPVAADAVAHHLWPGNVRELRNFLERIAVFSEGGASMVDAAAQLLETGDDGTGSDLSIATLDALPYRQAKAQFERHYLEGVLQRHNFNVAAAARQSGIDRVHLYRLIRKYKLQRQ